MTRTIRPAFLSSIAVDLQADALADYEERAAIIAEGCGVPMDEAEQAAARLVAKKYRAMKEAGQ
jgi:hypothetical protein